MVTKVHQSPPSADAWPLRCSVCEQPLATTGTTLVCPAGHSFDIAKEGYVNLLPPQHRVRGMTGDVAEMLRARRRFLEAGHYRPLQDLVVEAVVASLKARASKDDTGRGCVLEVGCGDGYYCGAVAERLCDRPGESGPVVVLGTDLSKPAVKFAAKRHPGVRFFVSDINQRVYVEEGSASAVLDVFAPRSPNEFARILEPGGTLLIVIPGAAHLEGVRERFGLLGIDSDKEERVVGRLAEAFELIDRRELAYPVRLDADEIGDLITMGPSYWHAAAGEAAAAGSGPVMAEAAFVLLTFRRSSDR